MTPRSRWFALDLRALALWRMALGAIVLADIVLRLRDLQAFYGDDGMLSRALYLRQSWQWDGYHLFLASGSTTGLLVMFALWATAATCLMIGYRTTVAAVLTWYFVASIQLRNPMVLDGGDDLLRLLLFWTPFLPVSARWSIDARRHPQWRLLPDAYRSVATAGLTLQIFVLYLFAGLLKTGDDWLVTGDALYFTLSIDQFSTWLGHILLGYAELLRYLTWAALGLEFGLAALLLLGGIFPKARTAFYVCAAGFHLGIAAMLNFGIFMAIAVLGLTAFLPTAWLDRMSLPVETSWPARGSDVPPSYHQAWWSQAFCAFIFGMILVFNAYSLNHGHKIPQWTKSISDLTFEQQHWHFFAPMPFREDGWFVLEVTGTDGKVTDGWSDGTPVGGRPVHIASRFANQRWRRWLQNLTQIDTPDNESWRRSTLRYAAQQWQSANPGSQARLFRLVLMQEINGLPGQTGPVKRMVLAEQAADAPALEIRVPGNATPPAPGRLHQHSHPQE